MKSFGLVGFCCYFETGFLCVVATVLDRTHSIDQVSLDLKDLSASVSWLHQHRRAS